MIYAVTNTKGGVGKTTTAVHLATMLARIAGTVLIDGDPQASAASWAGWRREYKGDLSKSPTTICLAGRAIHSEGMELAKKYHHVVVDAGGHDTTGMRSALILADVAIVPIGASYLDAAAMTDLLEVVELSRDYNPDLVVKVLLTRVNSRTKDLTLMNNWLQENHLNVLTTHISERVAFRRSIGEGLTVQELGKDAAAIAEIEAFFKEVYGNEK